jgi:two-component system response regulator RegA
MMSDSSKELSVLIVEDEPRLRELLLRAVTSWGFAATGARSAEEALRLMQGEPRRIVIMDLNLPGEMNGIDGLEAMHERWPKTVAIILTGFGDLEAAKKAIHLDVVDFLTKPCHLGDLEVAMDRARRRIAPPVKPTIAPIEMMDSEEEKAPVAAPPSEDAPRTLEELEREHILAALGRHDGNRAATAAELGISLRTLYYRLGEYQQKGYLK